MASSDDHTPTLSDEAETTGRIVVALIDSRSQAEAAIRALKDAGFSDEQIGVATQDYVRPALSRDETPENDEERAEDAETGALTGGIIGGLVGLISSVLIPGVGALVVGGVLASALTGVGLGAAAGGLVGALVGMGVPQEEARYFDAGLRGGRTLVTVKATERLPEALGILQSHSADLGSATSGHRLKEKTTYRGPDRRNRTVGYAGPERRLEVA